MPYTLLIANNNISKSMGYVLAKNRRNSFPCTVRTSRQRSGRTVKRLVICNSLDIETLDLLNGLAVGCCNKPSPEVNDQSNNSYESAIH